MCLLWLPWHPALVLFKHRIHVLSPPRYCSSCIRIPALPLRFTHFFLLISNHTHRLICTFSTEMNSTIALSLDAPSVGDQLSSLPPLAYIRNLTILPLLQKESPLFIDCKAQNNAVLDPSLIASDRDIITYHSRVSECWSNDRQKLRILVPMNTDMLTRDCEVRCWSYNEDLNVDFALGPGQMLPVAENQSFFFAKDK